MSLAASWQWRGGDACGEFFATALKAFDPPLAPDASVLEVGCAEFDWLCVAHEQWPAMTLLGIDTRTKAKGKCDTPQITRMKADVMTVDLPAQSYDWVIGISSLEHIGLGHYGDPKNPDGDVIAFQRIYEWLKPGGWLYFDVPWSAEPYHVLGTECRVYDDATIDSRLKQGLPWREAWTGVVTINRTRELLADPCPPLEKGHRFFYKGFWWQKPEAA